MDLETGDTDGIFSARSYSGCVAAFPCLSLGSSSLAQYLGALAADSYSLCAVLAGILSLDLRQASGDHRHPQV